jgi:vacuolar-type H+-ATPase subunit I/STV1
MLKQLHEVMTDEMTVNITVKKKGDQVLIMVGAKANVNDKAFDNIPPFTASGLPLQVETELIETVKQPFQQLGNTISGVAEFEAKQKQIDAENAAVKAEKEQKKKENEKADKEIKKLLEQGNQAIEEKKDITASQIESKITQLLQGRKNNDFNEFVEKLKQLKVELGTGTLFGQ